MPMTTAQAGVVDAVLTNWYRAYRNQARIYPALFPVATVPARSSRLIKFGKSDFVRLQTRRAPGSPVLTVSYGYLSDPIALVADALQGLVPVELQEEAARIPGIDMGRDAVRSVAEALDLGHEIDAAALARDPATYAAGNKLALAGADRWNDPASKPDEDIKAAKAAIRRMTGSEPNTLVLGADVGDALSAHPAIKERFKYTSSESVTPKMLAAYFDLASVVIGKGVHRPDGAAEDAPMLDIWGKDAILATTNPNPAMGSPSFGYTYQLAGYPFVEVPWFDKDCRSWKYPTFMERRPYVVGADAGFLFQTAVD